MSTTNTNNNNSATIGLTQVFDEDSAAGADMAGITTSSLQKKMRGAQSDEPMVERTDEPKDEPKPNAT